MVGDERKEWATAGYNVGFAAAVQLIEQRVYFLGYGCQDSEKYHTALSDVRLVLKNLEAPPPSNELFVELKTHPPTN
jgi:hypothetical protein